MQGKTKAQLLTELDRLKARVTELEGALAEKTSRDSGSPISDQQWKQLIEFASEGVTLVQNQRVIYANPKAVEILGFSLRELYAINAFDFVDPRDISLLKDRLQSRNRGEELDPSFETRIITKLGEVRWIENNVVEVSINNQPTFLSLFTDTTDRREAEAVQKRQNYELAVLNSLSNKITIDLSLPDAIEGLIDGVAEAIEADLVVLFREDAGNLMLLGAGPKGTKFKHEATPTHVVGECLCGLAAELGEPVYSHDIHRDQRCTWDECKNAGIRSLAAIPLRVGSDTLGVLGVATGGERDLEEHLTFLETLAGTIAIALQHKIFYEQLRRHTDELEQNIQDRMMVEEELRIQANNNEQILNTTLDGYILADTEGQLVAVNPAYRLLIGYSETELLQMNIRDLEVKISPDEVERRIQTMVSKGSDRFESQHRHKHGQVIDLDVSIVILQTEEQPLVAAFVRDVTAEKSILEELKQSRQQLRNLARYLQNALEEERTHIAREIHDEFGQVLTALKMDLVWMSKKLEPDQTVFDEKIKTMVVLVEETTKTVQGIAAQLRPGMLDDLGLTSAMEWQLQEFASRTGIVCELRLPDEEVTLGNDRETNLFRIFQEALTNIARHSKATKVEVDLHLDTSDVKLTIRDNGVGVAEDLLSSPSSLGLLGIRERAWSMDGKITIQGVRGQGTTVELIVPR